MANERVEVLMPTSAVYAARILGHFAWTHGAVLGMIVDETPDVYRIQIEGPAWHTADGRFACLPGRFLQPQHLAGPVGRLP